MEKKKNRDKGEFLSLVWATEVMKQVEQSLKEEPANILRAICKEYEKSGEPVPDYKLHLSGYIGEVSLKALLQAGLISQRSGGRLAIFSYIPTESGLQHYHHFKNLNAA